MTKTTSDAAILLLTLDRALDQPLQTQLAQALRSLVHRNRLRSGDRLPSSRGLAQELSVSRVTVTSVYDQLIAEGYLEGRRGSGVYVAADLPDMPPVEIRAVSDPTHTGADALSPVRPFLHSAADQREFPFADWSRLSDQIWRRPEPALMARQDPMGWPPLRAAIAAHLRDWRGLDCAAEQVVVTSGLVETIDLVARTTLSPGRTVAVEEPGHSVLLKALANLGLKIAPVHVDAQGFDIARAPEVSAVVVTPSRQFPLGMVMPLARRLKLLEWARETGGLILEDDFDGEIRYQGQPLPAMMSLDDGHRVLYVGSFSKVMFPALRLAFAVLPEPLVQPVREVIGGIGPKASLVSQPVLARFIADGAFATHLRRMRRLYGTRQKALLDALDRHARGLIEAESAAGGMHLIARPGPALRGRLTDREACALAAKAGISVRALSDFFAGTPDEEGFVLGYAGYAEAELDTAVRAWVGMLRR